MTDPRSEIGELFRLLTREMHERFRNTFKDLGLPPMALILLRIIHEEPGVTVSELGRQAGTVKSHVSKLIDQLVSQGYVEKRPDPADQRLLRIYTTQASAELKAGMESRARGIWLEVMAEVPEAEAAGMAHSLRTLLTAFKRSGGKAPKD